MSVLELREIYRQLDKLQIRCDYLEANQRNAESGTTACSDAGGVVEQVKTAGSADREPLLSEFEAYMEERLEWASDQFLGGFFTKPSVEFYEDVLKECRKFSEGRR